jgi:hypothetical protein
MRLLRAALAAVPLVAACSSAAPSQEFVSSSGSAASVAPFVQLRFAQAEATVADVPQGPDQGNLYATGIIEVANVAYEKQIVVHYQGPSGWVDANASYFGPSANPANELWSFRTGAYQYLPEFSGEAVYFAVEYTANGVTVWDNDGGANYVVGVRGGDGVPECPVALGEDALKVSDYALTSGASGLTFAGHVVLKNLAYQKTVNVVATTDDWATTLIVPASYAGAEPGSLEDWSFSATLPSNVTIVQFAVSYEANGTTYWDDDLGTNYQVKP